MQRVGQTGQCWVENSGQQKAASLEHTMADSWVDATVSYWETTRAGSRAAMMAVSTAEMMAV